MSIGDPGKSHQWGLLKNLSLALTNIVLPWLELFSQ